MPFCSDYEYLLYASDVNAMPNRKSATVEGEAVHPIVRPHPETGQQALYVSPAFLAQFEDMTKESRPILEHMFRTMMRPEVQIRYTWNVDTFGMWDNRLTLHYAANDYDGERRVMHRMVVNEPTKRA